MTGNAWIVPGLVMGAAVSLDTAANTLDDEGLHNAAEVLRNAARVAHQALRVVTNDVQQAMRNEL